MIRSSATRRRRALAAALLHALGAAAWTASTPAPAATIPVLSAADPGDAGTCTLRQAIVTMNHGGTAGADEGTCRQIADVTKYAFGVNDTIQFDVGAFPPRAGPIR